MVYNPSEPRDPLGKWMKAHGGNPKASLADNVKNLNYAEEHGAAVDTKNTPTAVIDQIAKTGKDEDNRLEALMNPNISDETLDQRRREGAHGSRVQSETGRQDARHDGGR